MLFAPARHPEDRARTRRRPARRDLAALVLGGVTTLVGFAGCRDAQLTALEAIKTEVCACTTAACAEAALARVPQGTVRATPASRKVARDMLDCVAQRYAAERPQAGPDGELGGGTTLDKPASTPPPGPP